LIGGNDYIASTSVYLAVVYKSRRKKLLVSTNLNFNININYNLKLQK